MMSFVRKILVLMTLAFGLGVVTAPIHTPVAKADLVDDANKGREEAEEFGLGAIGIGLVLAIAGTVFCILFPPTRRFGIALGSGLLILIVMVIISKSTSIGETLGDIVGADSVTDIFSK
jgi:hypothetical protein